MKKVEKILGREKFVNKKYCGKILNLKKFCTMHCHKQDETK